MPHTPSLPHAASHQSQPSRLAPPPTSHHRRRRHGLPHCQNTAHSQDLSRLSEPPSPRKGKKKKKKKPLQPLTPPTATVPSHRRQQLPSPQHALRAQPQPHHLSSTLHSRRQPQPAHRQIASHSQDLSCRTRTTTAAIALLSDRRPPHHAAIAWLFEFHRTWDMTAFVSA